MSLEPGLPAADAILQRRDEHVHDLMYLERPVRRGDPVLRCAEWDLRDVPERQQLRGDAGDAALRRCDEDLRAVPNERSMRRRDSGVRRRLVRGVQRRFRHRGERRVSCERSARM